MSKTAERFCDWAITASRSSREASASMANRTLISSKPLRMPGSAPRMPRTFIRPSIAALTERSWMPRSSATAATPAVRQPARPTRTNSTGVGPLSCAAKHSGWSTSNSYVVRCRCSAHRPVKPATVDWLWAPLRQVQLARQVNWAASGAADSAARASSRACTFTPLSAGRSVTVTGFSCGFAGSGGGSAPARIGPEDDGKRGEPAQDEAVAARPAERAAVDGEPQPRVPGEQALKCDAGFEPGQRGAEAVVNAVAEPKVRRSLAADVQDVGRREADRVTVGRAQAHQYLLVRGDLNPAQRHRLGRHPERGMGDGGGEADELIDRGGKLPRVGRQRPELAGVIEQGHHAVADE